MRFSAISISLTVTIPAVIEIYRTMNPRTNDCAIVVAPIDHLTKLPRIIEVSFYNAEP